MNEFLVVLMLIGVGFGVLLGIIFLAVFAMYFRLWLRAYFSRAWISPFTLVFMSLRKVNPTTIVDAHIMALQAGLKGITAIDDAGNATVIVPGALDEQRASTRGPHSE